MESSFCSSFVAGIVMVVHNRLPEMMQSANEMRCERKKDLNVGDCDDIVKVDLNVIGIPIKAGRARVADSTRCTYIKTLPRYNHSPFWSFFVRCPKVSLPSTTPRIGVRR